MIPEKQETNKAIPESTLAFCLERVFRPWQREREPLWHTKGSLSWEDRAKSPGRPKQLASTRQTAEMRKLHRENSGDFPHEDPLEFS